MPLKPGKTAVSQNITELHTGNTYSKTKAKFGKKKANAQAVAIALKTAGMSYADRLKKKGPR